MARIVDDTGLIAIDVDRSVWLDARGEDVPGQLVGPVQRAWVHGPVRTVGREHRPNLRSVHVHSVATRGSPHIAVPSPPHISLPCAAHQSECGRTPLARGHHQGGTQPMTPHTTGSTTTPGDSLATAPPTRTFGLQGPTLGALIDAYLQDYQVRQFRSVSTARGRVAHLTAFFGRAARAAALTTYQIRQYQLTRRAAGAATGTINRETSALHRMCTLAVHWGWLDTVPGFPDRLRENPPRQGFFEHPEYLAVRAYLPAPWQDILDLAYYSGWRKQEILGLTWDEIDEAGGVIRLSPARSKTLVGRILPISHPIAEALVRRRARRDPDSPLVFHRDGIPVRRWRTTWRTACQAAGVPTRFLHDCRRTAARNLIRANVPERVAMLLTGHKSRAIFDRYNIINKQELLEAGDQLVAYLAQQAQAMPAPLAAPRGRSRRPAHRITPPPRTTRHRVRMRGPPASREAGAGPPPVCAPQVASSPHRTGRPAIVATGRAEALVRGCGQAYALQTVEPVTYRCGMRRVCQARSSGSERDTRARPHAVAPDELRARRQSPTIDLYRKNAFSTHAC